MECLHVAAVDGERPVFAQDEVDVMAGDEVAAGGRGQCRIAGWGGPVG